MLFMPALSIHHSTKSLLRNRLAAFCFVEGI